MVYDMCMSEEDELDEGGYPVVKKKEPKASIKLFGTQWYGDTFVTFQKVGECRGNLPAFKELYYLRKVANLQTTTKAIIMEFNKTIAPDRLHPYPNTLKQWTHKWDKNILEQLNFKKAELVVKQEVHQVIKTRASDTAIAYNVPEDGALEEGVRTLAGELLNDGMQMLRDDQEMEEIFDTDELIKRRNYVLNVLNHTTRMVQGKAALMLKASQEKRETAGFLMDLMREAAAGKFSKDKLDILKSAVVPTPAPIHHEHANAG